MPLSDKALVASLIAGVLFTLSPAAGAPTPAAAPVHKSAPVTNLDNGDALMIGHKGQRMFKSNIKVSEATHESAMAKGAKEIHADTCNLQTRRQVLHVARKCITNIPGWLRRRLLTRGRDRQRAASSPPVTARTAATM
jgi:hypothetical protein